MLLDVSNASIQNGHLVFFHLTQWKELLSLKITIRIRLLSENSVIVLARAYSLYPKIRTIDTKNHP